MTNEKQPGGGGLDARPDIRFVIGLFAAGLFLVAGFQMVNLRSEAGNTIAELFDQAVGWLAFGLAALSVALTWPRPRA